MIFEQINVGSHKNLAYLIGDVTIQEAVVIDPSYEPEKVIQKAQQHQLTIKYLINTHSHFDHINGNAYILENTHAKLLHPKDNDIIGIGKVSLKIIATPGHTPDSICILVANKLLTGDTLFVGNVGIVASQEDALVEFNSLKKLAALDDTIEIYPGHDYSFKPSSSIGYEKQHNLCMRYVCGNDLTGFLAAP